MFWSDWEANPQIVRAGLYGIVVTPFVMTGVVCPNGLALKYPLNIRKLYGSTKADLWFEPYNQVDYVDSLKFVSQKTKWYSSTLLTMTYISSPHFCQ
jgi:hypothetical protein